MLSYYVLHYHHPGLTYCPETHKHKVLMMIEMKSMGQVQLLT